MTSFFIIFFLCFAFNNLNLSEASHHNNKLPSAVVVGTVFCDTCFQEDFSKNSHFISGASVSVECRDENSRLDFRKEVKTNEHGEFKVNLPFSVSKHVKKIKKCSVKLLTSSEPYCAVASTATSSSLHLKSRKQGIHIFSAGFFSFKPQKQPNLCNQKPRIQNSKEFNSQKIPIPPFPIGNNPIFPPPLQDPTIPNLPPVNQSPLPFLPLIPILPPLPELPPLPPLPSLPPLPPMPGTTPTTTTLLRSEQESGPNFFFPTPPILPPNPLQPPPVLPPNPLPIFPPIPFQPPPILPPNPLLPPPAPIIPLPPIPGLTPSPPPPIIPFPPLPPLPPLPPIPPVPFLPSPPRIPGIPPASSSSSSISQKTSP